MRKHWLRGMLLGVSLALLLAGGVALAAGLSLSVDKECVECWPGQGAPPDEYVFTITLTGLNPRYEFCNWWRVDGHVVAAAHCWPPPADPYWESHYVACGGSILSVLDAAALGEEAGAANDVIPYGEMKIRGWQVETGQSDVVTWLYAEDCAALQEEFVPEPGTIMLLGSGLAGLAGYATLRLRTRE